ncbi:PLASMODESMATA CALLOSE-BINDING PROTEIN 5 [Linum grandiflorum]
MDSKFCFLFSSRTLIPLLFLTLCSPPPLSADQTGAIVPRELWCVAKNNAPDAALQAAIDWACGAGGANCSPIQQGGPCYDDGDLQRAASWAFNDYFLKNGMTDDACDFSNTAALISLNPSRGNCKFPSSSGTSSFSTGTTMGMGRSDSADMSSSCKGSSSTWSWGLLAGYFFVLLLFR